MTVIQMVVLFIIILAAILNLSFNREADKTVWATLLSACMGYMLPGPNFKNLLVKNGQGNGVNSNGNGLEEVDGCNRNKKAAARKR